MHDFEHIVQHVGQSTGQSIKSHVRSPLAVGRVDTSPLFGRDSMVGIHWTCANTAAGTLADTWEGDSNTEDEVTSA
jgi:hypothetical protein